MPTHAPTDVRPRLDSFLRQRVRKVYFAEPGGTPPQLAYITAFPRLSLTLAGAHPMLIASRGPSKRIRPQPGEAVFVHANRWNKPDWSEAATVMTFLCGRQQVGISLTAHQGDGCEPEAIAKVSLNRPLDDVASNLIAALSALPAANDAGKLDCLVVESLLHTVLMQLGQASDRRVNKARRTYETVCLYVQENAHRTLTRESVAGHFGLSPSHVSRLFRSEGSMRFCDFVNLVRINRAKVLLADARSTIKGVAADCGYADTAYFCRVFLRFAKVTPTEYRLSRR